MKLDTYMYENKHKKGESLEVNNMAAAEVEFDTNITFYLELPINDKFNHSCRYKNTKYKHRWI